MAYSDVILADSPVNYWRLGESSGNAIDSAGTDDLVWSGTPTYSATGLLTGDANKAMTLDGSTDYASKTVTNFRGSDNVGSIECWFSAAEASVVRTLFASSDYDAPNTTSESRIVRCGISNLGQIEVACNNGQVNLVRSDISRVDDGSTHHAVFTSNGTNWKLYIDGAEVSAYGAVLRTDGLWFNDISTADRVSIGCFFVGSSASSFFNGTIDEVAVYDYALTAQQVSDHYDAGTASGVSASIPSISASPTVYAPTSTLSDNKASGIPSLSASPTLYAPTSSVAGANPTAAIPSISASPTLYAPTARTDTASQMPSISAVPTLYAPTVSATDNKRASIPAIASTLSTAAPVSRLGVKSNVPSISAGITRYAPTSRVTANVRSSIPSISLGQTYAPRSYLIDPSQDCLQVWVTLAGTDITSSVIGPIRVEEQERSSSLCDFAMIPGATLTPRAEVVVEFYDGDTRKRLFSGIVDRYNWQPDSGQIEVLATTDLQGRMRALTREQIKALTGGYWHPELSDGRGDNWEYALEVLDTVPRDLHVGRDGGLVVCDWSGGDEVAITDSQRLSGTLRGSMAEVRNIVNRNLVTVQHRKKREKTRELSVSWSVSMDDAVVSYAPDPTLVGFQVASRGFALPSDDMAEQALEGTGWDIASISFERPWESHGDRYLGIRGKPTASDGTTVTVDNSELWHMTESGNFASGTLAWYAWNGSLINGFAATMQKTWDQDIITNYVIDVKCQASITLLGEYAVTENWGLREPEETATPGALTTLANGDAYRDYSDPATDLQGLIDTAVARASTEILASHRLHTESFSAPFSHAYRLDTRGVVSGTLSCSGKISSIVSSIDPDNGTATSEITLSISGLDGQGLDTPQPYQREAVPVNDPLDSYSNITLQTILGNSTGSPPRSTYDDVSAYFSDYVQVDSENFTLLDLTEADDLESYGREFQVIAPEIAAASVDDREQNIDSEVIVRVPVDSYSITFDGACS